MSTCWNSMEFKKATRERTCCTMLSFDVAHATRDFEFAGFLCLTKVKLTTSLLIFFPRWINSRWGRQSSNRNHCFNKIFPHQFKMYSLGNQTMITPRRNHSNQIDNRTQSNLIEWLGTIKFGNRTQSKSHKNVLVYIEPNRTLIELYWLGSMVEVGIHSIKNGLLYRKIVHVLLHVSFF